MLATLAEELRMLRKLKMMGLKILILINKEILFTFLMS